MFSVNPETEVVPEWDKVGAIVVVPEQEATDYFEIRYWVTQEELVAEFGIQRGEELWGILENIRPKKILMIAPEIVQMFLRSAGMKENQHVKDAFGVPFKYLLERRDVQ